MSKPNRIYPTESAATSRSSLIPSGRAKRGLGGVLVGHAAQPTEDPRQDAGLEPEPPKAEPK
jgi:hypothetical protein